MTENELNYFCVYFVLLQSELQERSIFQDPVQDHGGGTNLPAGYYSYSFAGLCLSWSCILVFILAVFHEIALFIEMHNIFCGDASMLNFPNRYYILKIL